MSSPAIDYGALAEQARQSQATVDYSALADQARGVSKPEAPSADTPGGKLQSYLAQHFPNVAHYLGVSPPTPTDEAEFQKNEQDHAQFIKDHPVLHEVTKAVLNDPTVGPNILSAGAVPPGLIRQGAGLVKNAVQATAEMGGSEFAQSPLGKLLPERRPQCAAVLQRRGRVPICAQ